MKKPKAATAALVAAPAADSAEAAPVVATGDPSSGGSDFGDVLVAAEGEITFPVSILLRNHGRLPVKEAATGAFVGAGGSVTVAVHSREQLERMRSNIAEIQSRSGSNLFVSGMPGTAE